MQGSVGYKIKNRKIRCISAKQYREINVVEKVKIDIS